MTLHQEVQAALACYKFIDTTHPLMVAYSDWLYAKAHRSAVRPAAKRLRRELRLEHAISDVLHGSEVAA